MGHSEPRTSTSFLLMGTQESVPRATLDARRQAFRALHEGGCFVIPNPWDVGSARYLQHLGFPALATTSAGFAFSQGLPDSDVAVSCDRSLTHIAEIVAEVDLPVNAALRRATGFNRTKWLTASHGCAATGVAGLSVEDATGDRAAPLYDLPQRISGRARRVGSDLRGEHDDEGS